MSAQTTAARPSTPATSERLRAVLRDPRARSLALLAAVLVFGIPLASSFHEWPFVVTGISDGAIYSLAALGLVLTYKTSGIFNLAIGAQAAASAYVFHTFRDEHGWPWPLAAIATLVLVGMLGSLILERIAFWLSDAPAILRVVATIGVLVLLQSLLTGLYGVATIPTTSFLPQHQFKLGGITVTYSQVIIVALALAATIGLYLFFRNSRLGVSMQAVVEDPSLLGLQAVNPVAVRRYAWAIGSSFVSISGMLIAPTIGIDVNQLLVVFIAAFGAAAVAAFTSLAGAFAASIAIGIAMNITADRLSTSSNNIIAVLYTQIPFIVLVIALIVLPKRLLTERGARRVRRFGPVRSFPREAVAVSTLASVALAIAIPFLIENAYITQYTTAVGFIVILMSLGLLLWTSGQISLCQVAFAAVGAVTVSHAQNNGVPFLIALGLAALVGMVVGGVVAIPTFRLSGTFVAITTFGVGLLFQNLLYQTDWMFSIYGNANIKRPDLPGLHTTSDKGYYFVAIAVAAVCAVVVVRVRRSRLGRLLRALSDSPVALDAHGADTRRTRLFVFAISAAMAAVGGGLIGGVTESASSQATGPFGYFNSLILVAILAFCRRQPILSPVLAGVIFVVLKLYKPFNEANVVKYQGVVFGLLAIAVAVVPGITGWRTSRRVGEREGRGRVAARLDPTAEAVAA